MGSFFCLLLIPDICVKFLQTSIPDIVKLGHSTTDEMERLDERIHEGESTSVSALELAKKVRIDAREKVEPVLETYLSKLLQEVQEVLDGMDDMFNSLNEEYESEVDKAKPLEERRDEIRKNLATGDEEKARLKVSIMEHNLFSSFRVH